MGYQLIVTMLNQEKAKHDTKCTFNGNATSFSLHVVAISVLHAARRVEIISFSSQSEIKIPYQTQT